METMTLEMTDKNVPFKPSLLLLFGVVGNRIPSPGAATSKTSIASSKPQ